MFHQPEKSYRCIAMLTRRPLASLTTVMLVTWGVIFLYLATDRTITEDESLHINIRRQKYRKTRVKHGSQVKDQFWPLESFVQDSGLFMEDGMLLDMSSIRRRRKEMFRKFDKIHQDEKLKSLRKEKLAKLDKLHENSTKNVEIAGVNKDDSTGTVAETSENSGSEATRNRDEFEAGRNSYLENLANQTHDMDSRIVDANSNMNRSEEEQLTEDIQQAPGNMLLQKNYAENEVPGSKDNGHVRNSNQGKHEKEEGKRNSKEVNKVGTSSSKDMDGRNKGDGEEVKAEEGPRSDNQEFSINKEGLNKDTDGKLLTDNVNKNGNENEGQNQNEYKTVGGDGERSKVRDSKERNDVVQMNIGKAIRNPANTDVQEGQDSNGNKVDSRSKNGTLEGDGKQTNHEAYDGYNRDGEEVTVDNKEMKNSTKRKDGIESKEKIGMKEIMDGKQRKDKRDRKLNEMETKGKKEGQRLNVVGKRLKRKAIMSHRGTELAHNENTEGNKKRRDSMHDIWQQKFKRAKDSRRTQRTNKNKFLLQKEIESWKVKRNYKQEQLDDSGIKNKTIDSGLVEHRRRENFYGRGANIKGSKGSKDSKDSKDSNDKKDIKEGQGSKERKDSKNGKNINKENDTTIERTTKI